MNRVHHVMFGQNSPFLEVIHSILRGYDDVSNHQPNEMLQFCERSSRLLHTYAQNKAVAISSNDLVFTNEIFIRVNIVHLYSNTLFKVL